MLLVLRSHWKQSELLLLNQVLLLLRQKISLYCIVNTYKLTFIIFLDPQSRKVDNYDRISSQGQAGKISRM
ncbi:hypothetical protein C8J56DRAFT_969424 [Mycena floridula]|nr:hypothetical protein C8J56DRAFT_969424 [Mycena floridula]